MLTRHGAAAAAAKCSSDGGCVDAARRRAPHVCSDFKWLVSEYGYVCACYTTSMTTHVSETMAGNRRRRSPTWPAVRLRHNTSHTPASAAAHAGRTLRLSISYPASTRFTALGFSFPSPPVSPVPLRWTCGQQHRLWRRHPVPTTSDSQCHDAPRLDKHRWLAMPSLA